MKKGFTILALLFVAIFVATQAMMLPSASYERRAARSLAEPDTAAVEADSTAVEAIKADSAADTATSGGDALLPDTTQMDSLQLAVYRHNKAIDDSIRADSLNRQKKNSIEAPVVYTANDSIVYDAIGKKAYLYGESTVKYQNMDLASDRISINLDSNIVHATGAYTDSTETEIKGKPVFQMGQDTYDSDTMSMNFKTKKGLIGNVRTEQEDGFLFSERSKRNEKGDFFLEHGRYTTCDAEHPDFYIALSRARVRPGKDVVFGPAHLVVADVHLPLAIPYGFFPFSKSYSSGFIMPTYGDESARGFYLRDGGYYFAISDKMDLKLLGEIYTKGSWGVSAASNYRRRYRHSGSFFFSYQDTKNGDKGMPDFNESESFKIQWNHRQDPKANPFSTLSASVNFATTSYERNNLSSLYNPQSLTQSTRTSSVSYSTNFSSIGMSISTTMNLNQNMRDSIIELTLPDLNISISRFYPFKRKHAAGKEQWYEKIAMSYTGQISNRIHTKENMLMHSSLVKDWRNGMNNSIPISASFTVLDYINVTPSVNITDRVYLSKTMRSWDRQYQQEVADTLHGFYNIYNWNMSLSASTKLYGMFIPNRKIFGDKVQAIRHVFTPKVSFSYAPDFSSSRYGYYETYEKTDAQGNVTLVEYSPFSDGMYGVPGKGLTGSVNFDIGNNIEMKIKSDALEDSTGFKKISLIDELGASMSYNMAAKEHPWSDLSVRLRLKLTKSYTFNLNAQFATYAYELDEEGRPYIGNRTEYSKGRFGRFQGMTQHFSYTLTPEKILRFFRGEKKKDTEEKEDSEDDDEFDVNSNIDDDMERGKRPAKSSKSEKAETDADGYMAFKMPWTLTFGYSVSMRENTSGKFNEKRMRYPYKFTQNLNLSGNISIADGWNISFTSGYDFENKAMSMTTASLSRDLHCFNMSASVVLAPYTSYNFTFRCNASTLTDALKYDKRSGYSNAVQWY